VTLARTRLPTAYHIQFYVVLGQFVFPPAQHNRGDQ